MVIWLNKLNIYGGVAEGKDFWGCVVGRMCVCWGVGGGRDIARNIKYMCVLCVEGVSFSFCGIVEH